MFFAFAGLYIFAENFGRTDRRWTEHERADGRMDWLRKRQLIDKLGLPKSTVSDWINEFGVFIPVVKQGATTFYKPETLDVLNAIRELREKGYAKPQIYKALAEQGFPITVEEAVDEIAVALDQTDHRSNLLAVMQQMGQAMSHIVQQREQLEELQEKTDEQDGRIGELERKFERMEQLEKQVEQLRTELETERKKGFWQRLLGK